MDLLAAKVDTAGEWLEACNRKADIALAELQSQTVASRLSRLVRARTEGDTYTRHLGLIATIRKDFELLTHLLRAADPGATSSDAPEQERKAWDEHVAEIRKRIEQLKIANDRLLATAGSKDGKPRPRSDDGPHEWINFGQRLQDQLDTVAQELAQALENNRRIDRIVLVIDDLDRCPPEKVYDVLQAVHLFLNFPLFIVLVAVDTRWMETSLKQELGALVDGSEGATTLDYLEKIFQIPYWTKALDAARAKTLIGGLLNAMEQTEVLPQKLSGTDPPTAKDLPTSAAAPSAAPEEPEPGSIMDIRSDPPVETPETMAGADVVMVVLDEEEREYISQIGGYAGITPRRVVRFLNVYMLLKSVLWTRRGDRALQLKGPGSRALLTQLAICTGTPEQSGLYFKILEQVAGAVTLAGGRPESSARAEVSKLRPALEQAFDSRAVPGPARKRILEALEVYIATEAASPGMLLAWLAVTAPDARTYTFAAPEALRRALAWTGTPVEDHAPEPVASLAQWSTGSSGPDG